MGVLGFPFFLRFRLINNFTTETIESQAATSNDCCIYNSRDGNTILNSTFDFLQLF